MPTMPYYNWLYPAVRISNYVSYDVIAQTLHVPPNYLTCQQSSLAVFLIFLKESTRPFQENSYEIISASERGNFGSDFVGEPMFCNMAANAGLLIPPRPKRRTTVRSCSILSSKRLVK